MKKLIFIFTMSLLACFSKMSFAWTVNYTCKADRVTLGGTLMDTRGNIMSFPAAFTEDYWGNPEVYTNAVVTKTGRGTHISKSRAWEKARDAACGAAVRGLVDYFTAPDHPERSLNLIQHFCVLYRTTKAQYEQNVWFSLGHTRPPATYGGTPIYGWVRASAWPEGYWTILPYFYKTEIIDKGHLAHAWDTWHHCPSF